MRRAGLRDRVRSAHTAGRAACHRNWRPLGNSGNWLPYEHLQELNRTLSFEPLSDADAKRLEDDARDRSSDNVLDRRVCAITDTWVYPRSSELVAIRDLPIQAMRAVLRGGPWCTSAIREYYDCSSFDPVLKGMLLARKAFCVGENGETYVCMTSPVLSELRALETRLARAGRGVVVAAKPPRFAIADGFVAGSYAELDDATCVEIQAVGLVQVRGVVKVVYGGPGNMLSSHLLCWDNRDATIASRLPSAVTRDRFQLILAGPITKAQDILVAKRHECDGGRVRRLLDLLCRVNVLYADMAIEPSSISSCNPDSITTRLNDECDTEGLVARARARQSTVARSGDSGESDECRECTVVESQTVLLETTIDKNEQSRLERGFTNTTAISNTYVARRSTSLLQSSDPQYMERLFPHLLTFGVGGFSTERHHRYSPRSVVLHYLNVSSNRFAEDAMFKLQMFDYLSTQRVKSGVFLRVGQDPAIATTATRVTPAQLKEAMRRRADQRAAWKAGQPTARTPASPAASLLRSINAAASKMWGSNEERESMQRKVDSMTILYGAPSIFWTLTPNPDSSLVCAFWTGRDLPGGRPDTLAKCGEFNMPCPSEMSRIVMKNTVVQAQYYRLCCELLIDGLFGWDSKANKPKSQRGIFGYVEALVYALEQQGRLFVHHHGVAWVAGLPRTQSDWERLLSSDRLRSKFTEYCASIFSAELPVYDLFQRVVCPLDGCSGELIPLPIPKKFKHVLKSSVPAPLVATCDACGRDFDEPTIVAAVIDSRWRELDDDGKAASTVAAVETIRHRFAGLSRDASTARVQLSRLLLRDQVHAWTHSRSCVKGQAGTKCRYKFFRDLVPETSLNRDNEIVFRRRVGNQWLNTFVGPWRRVLHFNMDARILWSGQGLQATRYALQYALKRQTVLDNVAVVDIAFQRRVSREEALQITDYARGIGRLLSLAYSTSGVMEIGGPLATAILFENGAVTFGCDFERLVLIEGLNILNDVDVEATVVSRRHEMIAQTSISKYINRPSCLEGFCWYDFCCWIYETGSAAACYTRLCTVVPDNTAQLREHLRTHKYRYAEYPRVPEIVGPRLPDATRLGDEDYDEQTELYYRMTALLYRPFRDPTVFLGSDGSARDHFERWQPLSDDKVARALERHQQHYICLQHAQQYRARQRSATEEHSDDDSVCEDDDVIPPSSFQHVDSSRFPVQYEAVPAEFYCVGDDPDVGIDVQARPDAVDSSPLAQLLMRSISSAPLLEDASFAFTASADVITRNHIRKFQALDHTATVQHDCTPGSDVVTATTSIVVERYDRATQNISFDRAICPPPELEPCASIQDISAHFSLNYRQHVAFTLIAIPLLRRIAGRLAPVSTAPSVFDDSPVIVTGAGGTGKSQIVAAVRALAASWMQSNAVATVASTGIAASSLQGVTMHSSVGLGINARVLPKHITSPSDGLLKQWAPVHCVIADELSMIDLGFFGLWEEALRYAKENRDEDYGGLLVVLMFDHCQLRAAKGVAMYRCGNGKTPLTPAQDRGLLLYRKVKKTVYLTENMRFVNDPEWGQWLQSGRLGDWTSDCRSYIASLQLRTANPSSAYPHILQTISTDNSARVATNDMAIKTAVRSFCAERRVYVIAAQLSRRLQSDEIARIRQLPDNKTGHIPLYFQVYVGMPVRVKANQCVSKGVANGAAATIYHIDWDATTTFSLQLDGTWLASTQPRNVYIDIVHCPSSTRYPALPPNWPASVMPVHQATASIKIGLRSVSIKGFPLVPAFGTTVHGVQGETLDVVAVTSLRPPHVRRVDKHALYVALSRLRTRKGLHWIGALPTPDDFDFFRPDAEVLQEDNRLKALADATLVQFERLSAPDPRAAHVFTH